MCKYPILAYMLKLHISYVNNFHIIFKLLKLCIEYNLT
jgi:hypothetical protein